MIKQFVFRGIPVFIYDTEIRALRIGEDARDIIPIQQDTLLMQKFLLQVALHQQDPGNIYCQVEDIEVN